MGLFDRFKKSAEQVETVVPKTVVPKTAATKADAATTDASKPDVAKTPVSAAPAPPVEEAPVKKGFFGRLVEGLKKTKQLLKTDIRDLFKSEGRLVDEAFIEELRESLLKTDMGPKAASELVDEVFNQYRARIVHLEEMVNTIKVKLKSILAQDAAPIQLAATGPTVIMVSGVNGSGKTTSIAKLTQLFVGQGKKVVLGAADTFRAAAVEQLAIWANRLGAEIVRGESGSDPASVAHRAVATALQTGADVCIIDTAGRLQTQVNLMQELTKIQRVISKQIPDAPHEVILVLDATAGQNGLSQAKGFTEAVKCTGLILAKIDGTAKGGVIVPIRQQFGLPVKYVGIGEQATDLALFNPSEFVDALFEGLTPEVAAVAS